MHKEEKNHHVEKEHPAPHHPECACDKDCKCGCHEGKECTCDKECGCGCHGGCGCSKKCVFKLLALLIVFLAGMGFNELLHSCCAPCPMKAPRPAPMMPKAPAYVDDAGNTIIIINTDGGHAPAFAKHHGKKGGKHFKFHGKNKPAENSAQPEDTPTE